MNYLAGGVLALNGMIENVRGSTFVVIHVTDLIQVDREHDNKWYTDTV